MRRRLEAFRQVLGSAVARRGVALMGVCNVTPDSFSDGGRYVGIDTARARVEELLAEGADIIDVGGESTRPGAKPVTAAEQLARVLEVVRSAVQRGACVSIDTANPEVAAACLDAGACVVNDVSCLREPDLAKVVAASGAALLLMHARGTQDAMAGFSQYPDDAYADVVGDVVREWEDAAAQALRHGVERDALIMDPGLGFAKNGRHSLELLARTNEIVERLKHGSSAVRVPVAVGASRKSFLAVVDRAAPPAERTGASVLAAVYAAQSGASIVRVHDVRATAQAIDLARRLAMRGKGPARMLEGLLHLFARRSPSSVLTDVFDILVVTYVIYRALLVLRGTRAMQMGTGLGVLLLVFIVAKWANLTTLVYLLGALLASLPLIVVVIFQNDIRRGLMRVGARAFLAGVTHQQESKAIDEVVAAATELARHRVGALIAFEQDANLDEFVVGQGTPLDAAVQRDLLVSLFLPESLNKLHDGAVVIRNLRVAKAGVFFPMPDTKVHDKSLGSRHRAALGITEETDAVVVVVSEERGSISFCFNGNIVTNLDGASLRQALLGLFGQRARKRTGKPASKRGGMVTQTGTGSFRVTVPEGTGSHAAPPPRGEPAPNGEKEAVVVRPMAPAKPIETPVPVPVPSPDGRPRDNEG